MKNVIEKYYNMLYFCEYTLLFFYFQKDFKSFFIG